MKIEGIVTKYNGASGIIKDKNNKEYLIVKKNIKNNQKIKVNDIVRFVPEVFKTIEIEEHIATFIEKK